MLIVSSLDSRQLRLYAPILYGVSCLGLLAVLTPLGSIVNGAKSWISLRRRLPDRAVGVRQARR